MCDMFNRINRYLASPANGDFLIVDVQNKEMLEKIERRYQRSDITFLYASDSSLCHPDNMPRIDELTMRLSKEKKNFFIFELSSFLLLLGEKQWFASFKQWIDDGRTAGHAVIITYQCKEYLEKLMKSDSRRARKIVILDGERALSPHFIFVKQDLFDDNDKFIIRGIDRIPDTIERSRAPLIKTVSNDENEESKQEISFQLADVYVETSCQKSNFSKAPLYISEITDLYDMLCLAYPMTKALPKNACSDDDWRFIYTKLREFHSWCELIKANNNTFPDTKPAVYHSNDTQQRLNFLLYFFGLKLYPQKQNTYLFNATEKSSTPEEWIRHMYRDILSYRLDDKNFWDIYRQRKELLNKIGNPVDECLDYCKYIQTREKNALYYLTDNTDREKCCIFKTLNNNIDTLNEREQVLSLLKHIYPDLYYYLSDAYSFENASIDDYFKQYKYQKVINKIFPEFMSIVEKNAIERPYNRLFQARSTAIERINPDTTQSYFMDGMGVEYLSYIQSLCNQNKLHCHIRIYRCTLPSLTDINKKEFYDLLSNGKHPIKPISDIDNIKHDGRKTHDIDANDKKGELPVHLIDELNALSDTIKEIRTNLKNNTYEKAVLIADHGASRLAVIQHHENKWEMNNSGEHGGRCCPKSDLDEQPDSAVDDNGFWILANYDRFKGSRKAAVEVHGGATLEEVLVPIVEITCLNKNIEVKLLPIDINSNESPTNHLKISFSHRKKAAFRIYINQKFDAIRVEIITPKNEKFYYDATRSGDYIYVVNPVNCIKRRGEYTCNVYAGESCIASLLKLTAVDEAYEEFDIFNDHF